MTISQFIKICKSGKLKSAKIFDTVDKNFWDIEKIIFLNKNKAFYFDDSDGKNQIKPLIHTKDIAEIERVGCGDDEEYIFALRLKDGREFSVLFEMEDGYTPFLLSQKEIDNIKAVQEAIPQYLDELKGKRVEVRKTQYSPIYSVCDDTGDITSMCTECYVIRDFNYTAEMISGFPLVKLIDKNNADFYSLAFGVRLIDGTKYNVDDGECSTEDSVIISADSGNYFLACED